MRVSLSPGPCSPPPAFTRGDFNADGTIDSMDISGISDWLLGIGDPPSCMDAADLDDDGDVDIPDYDYLSLFLEGSGPPPLPPYPDCGYDSTSDTLDCEEHYHCMGSVGHADGNGVFFGYTYFF